MTLRKIARLGHPVLLRRAAEVADVHDPEVQRLIDDMVATMHDAGGIGLAAPQVHESVRIVVAIPLRSREEMEGSREDTSRPAPLVLVNPELTPVGDERALAVEGCLSIPEIRGLVPRYERVRYTGLDRHGRPVEGEATGLLARILQHEVDHLDGILFLGRMTDLRSLAFTSELRYLMQEAAGTTGDRA